MIAPSAAPARRCSTTEGLRLAVVALVAATALAAQFVPDLAALLEYDRAAVASGEFWRLLTGHFAHASWDQLVLDLAVFVVLGLAAPAPAVLRTLVASSLAIPVALWILLPQLASYRGLSGLSAALVCLLASDVLRDHFEGRAARGLTLAAAATLAGFAAKTAWELRTGTGLFLDTAGAGYVPVPLAHAVGGVCGILVVVATFRTPTTARRSSQPGRTDPSPCTDPTPGCAQDLDPSRAASPGSSQRRSQIRPRHVDHASEHLPAMINQS